jgi:hypothetical protein
MLTRSKTPTRAKSPCVSIKTPRKKQRAKSPITRPKSTPIIRYSPIMTRSKTPNLLQENIGVKSNVAQKSNIITRRTYKTAEKRPSSSHGAYYATARMIPTSNSRPVTPARVAMRPPTPSMNPRRPQTPIGNRFSTIPVYNVIDSSDSECSEDYDYGSRSTSPSRSMSINLSPESSSCSDSDSDDEQGNNTLYRRLLSENASFSCNFVKYFSGVVSFSIVLHKFTIYYTKLTNYIHNYCN